MIPKQIAHDQCIHRTVELLEKIPDLVPENPMLAPLLAEDTAKAFGITLTYGG